ncbi:VOC family protein [Acidobacteriota bacterium]
MIKLDHFVVHVDNDMNALNNLKAKIVPLGFPFEPKWGKGTKGFKATNIWIGEQYFEIVWLKRKDGGGWRSDWVEKYTGGHRGIIAIGLLTDELDRTVKELKERGIPVSDPERISFRWFFGLLKKSMPWRNAFPPSIPGTDLQIFFGELDSPQVMDKMKAYMVPNSSENGITGIQEALVKTKFSEEAWKYLHTLFPKAAEQGSRLVYDMGTTKLSFETNNSPDMVVELKAITTDPSHEGHCFTVGNVHVQTEPARIEGE